MNKYNVSSEGYTCSNCGRYGDLHSSCSKVRDLEAKPNDPACEDMFTPDYSLRKKLGIEETK